jgi:hypothetical protein
MKPKSSPNKENKFKQTPACQKADGSRKGTGKEC